SMGSAMALAAYETLSAHFSDTGLAPESYDLIVTGDLGNVGHEILCSLFARGGTDISAFYRDCGMLIYDSEAQDTHSGGSGCGCSASVLCGLLLNGMRSGRWNRILFAATGALMSPTSVMQGEDILGICHAVAFSNTK
ncbi:MAG: stage V sporulation protein AD, partial [Oscillospiraceae bacterium]|nr:stage V sporulation protein AD [Oscillospiraceae bacterium]